MYYFVKFEWDFNLLLYSHMGVCLQMELCNN